MPKWDVHFNLRLHTNNSDLVWLAAQIDALASVIRGIPIPPYVQERLDALNIIRAVQGTTGIEGTEFSEDEVKQILNSPIDDSPFRGSRDREEQEVRNAENLMHYVANVLKDNPNAPLSESLILSFHEILTQRIDYEHNEPGRYRDFRVTVGPYVPPETGDDVRRLMREFTRWFNSGAPTKWHPVVRAIVAHFYVVSIHPFGDGNGRTSRAVESYLLYQAGINARGFYSLANYYYRNRPEYIRSLNYIQIEMIGDLAPFVLFALRGLVEELRTVHAEVLAEVRIISFRDFARDLFDSEGRLGTRMGERLFHFLLELVTEPVSLRALRNRHHPISRFYSGMATRTIMRDVRLLQEYELVKVEGDLLKANLEVMDNFTS